MKRLLSTTFALLCLGTAATAAAQTSTQPTLTFHDDWTVEQEGQPSTDTPLRIRYDLDRLAQCRGPSWTITGYMMSNRGPVSSFTVASPWTTGPTAELNLAVSRGGNLELWFQVTDANGCSAWDSDHNWNFHTWVTHDPTVTFSADWSETLTGTLQAGSTLMVDYDIGRLPLCRAYYLNYVAWSVSLNYRFDGGEIFTAPLTTTWGEWNLQYWRQIPAFINIPPGVSQVEMWFSNTDRKACQEYDSDYGQNYIYQVQ
ncbi:DUF6209 family protein [Chondromyces crocatus]|uniref:CBM21 domain-containing protein n=1 Tax=Chondromyces crocatus TaxID=52 RepID=A0A0K1ELL1_CHOCO|nr:DUF6209 family protein [Chondromyces crocatus]AKT41503.1 uncharacterized protein CMC5_057110 [Chondromyces crocatus]